MSVSLSLSLNLRLTLSLSLTSYALVSANSGTTVRWSVSPSHKHLRRTLVHSTNKLHYCRASQYSGNPRMTEFGKESPTLRLYRHRHVRCAYVWDIFVLFICPVLPRSWFTNLYVVRQLAMRSFNSPVK